MRVLIAVICCISLVSATAVSAQSDTDDALPESRFVFFNPGASALPPEEVVAGLEEYGDYFRERGVIDFKPTYFKRADDMERSLDRWMEKGEMPWFGSMSVSYLLQHGFKYGYRPLTCALRGDDIYYREVFVARRGSGINSLEDAEGKIVAMVDVGADVLTWGSTFYFRGERDMGQFFSKVLKTDGPTSSVMAVIFRQADVGIVIKQLFERMSQRASRVWRDVHEVYATPKLHLSGHVVWDGAPQELRDKLREIVISDISKQPGGQKILDTFYIDGFESCTWEQYDSLEGKYLKQAGVDLPLGEERERIIENAVRRARGEAPLDSPDQTTAEQDGDRPSAQPVAKAKATSGNKDTSSESPDDDGSDPEDDRPEIETITQSNIEVEIRRDVSGEHIVLIATPPDSNEQIDEMEVEYYFGNRGRKGSDECDPWLRGKYLCTISPPSADVDRLSIELFITYANGQRRTSGIKKHRLD